ncbi:CHAT domain-containing protein [Aquimarina algicola]|uniref:CHAT domain-containing protein n=1 Tax=Aquimarina algicola TaxID=2589995 RepID=A0A504IY85_9FLAO|nr:CHAT domain-containing protein [Aquimarina algicola]TPN83004.1 CHAT domain-containing protein [Aquimarina algicola]
MTHIQYPLSYLLLFFGAILFAQTETTSEQDIHDFFERHYEQLNQNLQQKQYDRNIQLIKKLETESLYQQLDCYRQGKLLHKIGVSHYLLNQETEAILYFKDKVVPIWKNCEQVPPSEKANTIYNIGICYQYLNDLEAAKPYIDQALYIFENDPKYPLSQLALKYHGIGKFYQNLSDAFRSELYYKNAANLYKKQSESKEREFQAYNDLIAMNNDFKDHIKAKKYINQALLINTNYPTSISKLNLAWVYLNAGNTYLGLQEYNNAKQMINHSLKLLNDKNEPFYYAIALEIMALIYADEEKFKLAENNLLKSLELRKQIVEKGESKLSLVHAYENLSDILIRKGDLTTANQYLNKAFDILVPIVDFDQDHVPIIRTAKALDDEHLIRLIELKVQTFKAQHKTSGDIGYLKKALYTQHKIDSVINKSLISFQFEQSKLDFLNLKFEHYDQAVEDALTLYQVTDDPFYLKEAYFFSSRTKAIVLQYELNQVNALQSNVPANMIAKEKELRQEMHMQEALLTEAIEENRDSLLQTYSKAQYALDNYIKEIEQKEPTYFKEKYAFTKQLDIEDIQKSLPDDMAVVEYFSSAHTIYSFWITKNDFFPIRIARDAQLKNALHDFVAQCRDPKSEVSVPFSELIFDNLLQQGLAKTTQKINRLCIIPDGELHKLSFEALTDKKNYPNQFLIENYAVSYSYSTALLFRKQHRDKLDTYMGFGSKYSKDLTQKIKARKRFFGDENLAQLSLSQKEIEQGAAIFNGKTFIDTEATLENFLRHSSKADIIHLSLHGLVDVDDPKRSCIIFDDRQEQQEFLLAPRDLYSNRLNANLVLLSACHSASGKIYNGEGVLGMSKSFLLGGAHNILSSLWNASEASSLKITTSFLENIHAAQATDLALHEAKLNYLNNSEPNKRHPYYWANFILLGEIDTHKIYTNSSIWIGLVSAGILLFLLFMIRPLRRIRKRQK